MCQKRGNGKRRGYNRQGRWGTVRRRRSAAKGANQKLWRKLCLSNILFSSSSLRILRLFPMQRWKRISDSFPSQILFPISARKCDIEGAQCLKNTQKSLIFGNFDDFCGQFSKDWVKENTLQSLINVAPRLFIFEKKSTHYGLIEGATRIFNVSLSEAVKKNFNIFNIFG